MILFHVAFAINIYHHQVVINGQTINRGRHKSLCATHSLRLLLCRNLSWKKLRHQQPEAHEPSLLLTASLMAVNLQRKINVLKSTTQIGFVEWMMMWLQPDGGRPKAFTLGHSEARACLQVRIGKLMTFCVV
jgi:hypothetical protein